MEISLRKPLSAPNSRLTTNSTMTWVNLTAYAQLSALLILQNVRVATSDHELLCKVRGRLKPADLLCHQAREVDGDIVVKLSAHGLQANG